MVSEDRHNEPPQDRGLDRRALARAPAAEWALSHVLNHYYLDGCLGHDDDGVALSCDSMRA